MQTLKLPEYYLQMETPLSIHQLKSILRASSVPPDHQLTFAEVAERIPFQFAPMLLLQNNDSSTNAPMISKMTIHYPRTLNSVTHPNYVLYPPTRFTNWYWKKVWQ